jgi:hypothetical protein
VARAIKTAAFPANARAACWRLQSRPSWNRSATREITEAPCHADMDAFQELIATAPQTLAGLRAWASYLCEIGDSGEAWMF